MTYDELHKWIDDKRSQMRGGITRDTLVLILKECESVSKTADKDMAHIIADEALLSHIDSAEVIKAFNAIDKWYS